MKRLSIILLILFLVIPSSGYAFDKSIWLSAGVQQSKSSFSLGIRGKFWGGEIGWLNDMDYTSDEVLDYPVPHSSYTNLGWKNVDGIVGIDIYRYFNATPDLSFYFGPGIYAIERRQIAESNVTGWLYTQSKTEDIEVPLSIGLNKYEAGMVYGIGYHSIRGFNAQIGIRF